MRALVLVDVDNVLGCGRFAGILDFSERAAANIAHLTSGLALKDLICAFAFNTESVLRHALTFVDLRQAGSLIGDSLNVRDKVRAELGFVLTMPEAADILIERLVREAPDVAGAGPYEAAVLCSGDCGLAASLAAQASWNGWVKKAPDDKHLGTVWYRGEKAHAAVRKPPCVTRAKGVGNPPSLNAVSVEIAGGDDVAAWAGSRRPDAEGHLSLKELAQRIDREPWLLSQLGATDSTLRGLSRMTSRPTDDLTALAPVSTKDGLEVRGQRRSASIASDARPASVGIGAVRFEKPGTTVRTLLPVFLHQRLNGDCKLNIAGVPHGALLRQTTSGLWISDKSVRLKLQSSGRDLVAEVIHRGTDQPVAWWLFGNQKTKCKWRIRDEGHRVPVTLDVEANPITGRGGTALLAFGAPGRGGQVKCSGTIQAGKIGPGTLVGGALDGHCVGILAGKRPLAQGEELTTQAIQDVPLSDWLRQVPQEMWDLPLVVPV